MAANKTIGGINVTISATVDKFQKAMSLASKTLHGFVGSISKTIFSLKGLAAALTGGLTIGAFAKLTSNAMEQVDALGELSDKLGVSTEKLGGLQLAAAEAGISNELLEKSLTKLAAKTGLSADKALRQWIEDTSKLTTQSEKLAAATDMFGARGASMVRFLNGGTAALDEAYEAALNLGIALDRKAVAGVERAMDAFGRFKFAVSGIFRSLAAEIAPFIELLSNKATDFLASDGRGKGIGKAIADAVIEMAKFVSDAVAKMVASVLEAMGHLSLMIGRFRDSPIAKTMGLGFLSSDERQQAMIGAGDYFYRAKQIRENLPSATIDRLIKEAREAAAKQVGPQANGVGSLIGGLLGSANAKLAPTLGNARQFGEKLWSGVAAGIQSAPGLMLKGWIGANLAAGRNFTPMAGKASPRPALAFAESGSVESYRQQAAIRRQSENIQKKQLSTQERMLAKLDSIDRKTATVLEAGLA